jgi:4'-phosphopantetheinyl transferase
MEKMKQQIFSVEDAKVLVWELTENIDELISKLNLSDNELNEFGKLVSEKRKLEYLGVRIALMELIGKKVEIEYDTFGKPSLADKRYQISISHSKAWIAVMIDPARLVGVDIEIPTDKILKLYKRFLNNTEQKELTSGDKINKLMLAWSAKEVLYKIIGIEAVDFANQLHIFPFELNANGKFNAEHSKTKKNYELNYIQNPDYTLVYCLA